MLGTGQNSMDQPVLTPNSMILDGSRFLGLSHLEILGVLGERGLLREVSVTGQHSASRHSSGPGQKVPIPNYAQIGLFSNSGIGNQRPHNLGSIDALTA
jgi:hypothetical protein